MKSIQGWPIQPTFEEYENILVLIEVLAKRRGDIVTNNEESYLNARKPENNEHKGKE